jgi:formamidopyrimidine-DNA glycosylase
MRIRPAGAGRGQEREVPEFPEVEALRRELDGPVRVSPIERAGPAHVATLKTFDPPLKALEGRRLAGAKRRGKHLLFPTDDEELVLHIHLMSAGRLRRLTSGEKQPKAPAFRLSFENGDSLLLTEGGPKKRAKVGLFRPEAIEAENRLEEPCPRCGSPIARVDFEEHTIYYCPDCQTSGRVLADRRLSRLLR